jgi:hypothetical protein
MPKPPIDKPPPTPGPAPEPPAPLPLGSLQTHGPSGVTQLPPSAPHWPLHWFGSHRQSGQFCVSQVIPNPSAMHSEKHMAKLQLAPEEVELATDVDVADTLVDPAGMQSH